jgi:uncharacterized membrane protein
VLALFTREATPTGDTIAYTGATDPLDRILFALSLALLAATVIVDIIFVVVRSTLVAVDSPDALLGRVAAVNAIFIGSSNEVGAFESGVAARLLGAVPTVVLGGAATLGVVGVTAWRVPELRRLRELRREEEAAG